MLQKEIKLLFDAGTLKSCVIISDQISCSYLATFVKTRESSASITLDLRPRKSGDPVAVRQFKSIDSACSYISRYVGFKQFIVHL